MNSYERVMTALSNKEPDRVPVFPFLTSQGAQELELPVKEYFSKGKHIAEGQLRLSRKYPHDCLYPFFYASKEVEAFGGTTIFYENGAPNAGAPIIKHLEDVDKLQCPLPKESNTLEEPLQAIRILAQEKKGQIPIVSAVMSPFSLPSMLMGLEQWLDLLLFGDKTTRDKLLTITEDFCVTWANAQFEAGLDAIAFFDPLATSDVMTRKQFLEFDFELASRTIRRIKGPVVYASAGGRFKHIIDLIPQTGAIGVVLSSRDSILETKQTVGNKINIIGNLNNVEMASWTVEKTKREVDKCLQEGAKDGGFILADQHGELPACVHKDILIAILEEVWKVGKYGSDKTGIATKN